MGMYNFSYIPKKLMIKTTLFGKEPNFQSSVFF